MYEFPLEISRWVACPRCHYMALYYHANLLLKEKAIYNASWALRLFVSHTHVLSFKCHEKTNCFGRFGDIRILGA